MSNIDLIKSLKAYNLQNFYFVNDDIIFFSHHILFRIHNNILYACAFNNKHDNILHIKIYNNFINILLFYDDTYILYSICLDNMIEYNTKDYNIRKKLEQNIYKKILNINIGIFDIITILDFMINNENILTITLEKYNIHETCLHIYNITYQINYDSSLSLNCLDENLNDSYVPNNNQHDNYDFIIKPMILHYSYPKSEFKNSKFFTKYDCIFQNNVSKSDLEKICSQSILLPYDIGISSGKNIIGNNKINSYYILYIVCKYDHSIIIDTLYLWCGYVFTIIDNHIIAYDQQNEYVPHIIKELGSLEHLEKRLEYKEIINYCKENKINVDFTIIRDNKKGQFICKKKANHSFCAFLFTNENNENNENNIIDYKIFKNTYKYEYNINYNNINLKISKEYDYKSCLNEFQSFFL